MLDFSSDLGKQVLEEQSDDIVHITCLLEFLSTEITAKQNGFLVDMSPLIIMRAVSSTMHGVTQPDLGWHSSGLRRLNRIVSTSLAISSTVRDFPEAEL